MPANLAPPAPFVRLVAERANLAPAAWSPSALTLPWSSTTADNDTYVGVGAGIGPEFVEIDPPPTLTPARRCRACCAPFQDPLPLLIGRPWTRCTFCRRRRILPELGDGRGPADGQTTDERQVGGAGRARATGDRGGAAGSGDRPAAAQERRCADCRRSIAHRRTNARRCERCVVIHNAGRRTAWAQDHRRAR